MIKRAPLALNRLASRAVLVVSLVGMHPASAQAPLPPERPPEVTPAPPATAPATLVPEAPAVAPLPPERPEGLPKTAAAPAEAAQEAPDDTACRARLQHLGVRFTPLPAIADGTCGAARPLKVETVADGVPLTPAATLTCPVAEALARWSTEVRVAADRELKVAPTAYRSGGSYECRGQNHDPDAKMSDHAQAAAVDVMGFEFAGRPALAVGTVAEGSAEARFQAAIRASACGMFRTVLGPGADPEHANHLHLDERDRPKGFRICQ